MMRDARNVWSLLVGPAALAGCAAILGDFELGTPSTSAQDGAAFDTASPSGGDAGGGNDAASPSEGGGDETLACPAPQVVCGAGSNQVCADLNTSSGHCGACGHSCGGGMCAQGRCAPALVYQGTTVGPIAMDLNDVFFESNEAPSYRLLACPKTGCKAAPRQVTIMPFGIYAIETPAAGTIAFLSAPQNMSGTERPAVFSCTTTGCPSPPVSFVGDGLNGLEGRLKSAGGTIFGNTGGTGLFRSACTNGSCGPATFFGTLTRGTHGFAPAPDALYFIDAATRGSTIARCALGDTACTPATVVPGNASVVEALVVYAGKLFWLIPGRSGFMEGRLVSCDLPQCATVAPQATALDSPTGLVVDAGGAWWLMRSQRMHRRPTGCGHRTRCPARSRDRRRVRLLG
jgi:hypothetical protein